MLAGVVCALLCAWWFAPSTARASCGDYVTYRGQSSTAHGTMPMPEHHPAMPARPGAPCACTGPRCSQAPFTPVLPERLTLVRVHDLAAPMHASDGVGPEQAAHITADDAARPIRRSTSIFHPPRLSDFLS
jgi:hypothetical protein